MPATRRRSALSATFGTFVRGLQPTITFVAWIPCLRWGVPVRHLSTPEIDQPEIESGAAKTTPAAARLQIRRRNPSSTISCSTNQVL